MVFGCTVFVHNKQPNGSKLDPKAFKCIFFGYSPTQKGYKCYSPFLKKFFVSCDVTFYGDQLIYPNTRLQGENANENEHWDPTVSLPILQDVSQDASSSPPKNSRPIPIPSPSSSHDQEEQQPISERPFQVYSRRPKASQQDQSLNREPDPGESSDLNVPIAIRKGVRTCTKHPIYNFLTCTKLSSGFKAFTAKIDNEKIPRNIHEAIKDPKWEKAGQEEMRALHDNGTSEVVDLPWDKKVVGSK